MFLMFSRIDKMKSANLPLTKVSLQLVRPLLLRWGLFSSSE